jgi:hypothetical protein
VVSSFVLRKYAEPKDNEKEDEKKTRVFFSDLLNKHFSPSCVNPRGILLYPGRWLGFSVAEAERLAQDILSSSKNQVFLLRVAHPYTNTQNAAELNPHITSSASDKHIDERFLFEGPVGLGEVNLAGDTRFGLSHNFRRFFVVREKLYGSKPSFTPFFFQSFPSPLHTTNQFFLMITIQILQKNTFFLSPPDLDSQITKHLLPLSFLKQTS